MPRIKPGVLALALLSPGLAACRDRSAQSAPAYTYGLRGCMDAAEYCSNVHPGTVPHASCLYQACFQVSTSRVSNLRVQAVDNGNAYPRTWSAWHPRALSPGGGQFPCGATADKSGGLRLKIPLMTDRCTRTLEQDGVTYYEDFVASPVTECLAWVECGTR